jgi:hypothetical protein
VSNRKKYAKYMASLWDQVVPPGALADSEQLRYQLAELSGLYRITLAVGSGIGPAAFTDDALRRYMSISHRAVRSTRDILDETGILGMLDNEYELMARHLEFADLPRQESAILRAYGFRITDDDLRVIVYRVRNLARRQRHPREIRPSQALSMSLEQIQGAAKQFEANSKLAMVSREGGDTTPKNKPVRKERRWFKGLGQVVQGTGMSLADIGLAAGFLGFPVSIETAWGALASITAGVGIIMNGVGDLRSE